MDLHSLRCHVFIVLIFLHLVLLFFVCRISSFRSPTFQISGLLEIAVLNFESEMAGIQKFKVNPPEGRRLGNRRPNQLGNFLPCHNSNCVGAIASLRLVLELLLCPFSRNCLCNHASYYQALDTLHESQLLRKLVCGYQTKTACWNPMLNHELCKETKTYAPDSPCNCRARTWNAIVRKGGDLCGLLQKNLRERSFCTTF